MYIIYNVIKSNGIINCNKLYHILINKLIGEIKLSVYLLDLLVYQGFMRKKEIENATIFTKYHLFPRF